MAWDLDAATTALARDEVRRISDGLAHQVDRLRLCGNGVYPLAAGYAPFDTDYLARALQVTDAIIEEIEKLVPGAFTDAASAAQVAG